MIRTLILVGVGGGIGSMFRYLTSVLVTKHYQTSFPWATFIVNVLGCLIIGMITGLLVRHQSSNPDMKYLFTTGFCGGFTTFSAFASENISLMHSGHTFTVILYIASSILAGLLAVWFGLTLIKMF